MTCVEDIEPELLRPPNQRHFLQPKKIGNTDLVCTLMVAQKCCRIVQTGWNAENMTYRSNLKQRSNGGQNPVTAA